MKWYNKVFRNEDDGKDTIINFDDLDNDVKVILCCCADGLLPGNMNSYSYSDSISIDVLRSHNSYICYVNGVVFSDVPLNLLSDFFFETYGEKGTFDEISCPDEEHGNAAQNSGTGIEHERNIVYYDDHHIRLTREELELIKSALINFSYHKDRDLLNSLDYLLSLLDRVLGRGYDSSVVHLNDDDFPF